MHHDIIEYISGPPYDTDKTAVNSAERAGLVFNCYNYIIYHDQILN